MMALGVPAMLLGNPLTYGLLLAGMLLALTQVGTDSASLNLTLAMLRRSRLCQLTLLVLLALYAGTFTAIEPVYAVRHWAVLVAMATSGALLFHIFRQFNLEQRDAFLKWTVWGVQAAFVVALAIAVAEPWALPHGYYGEKPWTQTHLRFFSSVLAAVLPLCWIYWLNPGGGRFDAQRPGYRQGLAWVCVSVVMVMLCAGRAGWVGVAAAAGVWVAMMARYHSFRLPPPRQLAGLAIGSLLAGAAGYIGLYGLGSIEERIGVTVPDIGLGGGRLDLWRVALQHVFDQPWLGIGVNNFRFLPEAGAHPHDFLLQIWLESGIIGGGLTLLMLAAMGWSLFRRGKADVTAAAGLAVLAGFLVAALTNKSIYNPEWLVVLVVPAAFALAAPLMGGAKRGGATRR